MYSQPNFKVLKYTKMRYFYSLLKLLHAKSPQQPNLQQPPALNLLAARIQIIHVPIRRHKAPAQEPRLVRRQPHRRAAHELRRIQREARKFRRDHVGGHDARVQRDGGHVLGVLGGDVGGELQGEELAEGVGAVVGVDA